MLKTGNTYYPLISAIAFVGTGGLSYHLLTTACNADTFSGLCGFVAIGLSAVLLVSIIFGNKPKQSCDTIKKVEQEDTEDSSSCMTSHEVEPAKPVMTVDKADAIKSCREYLSMIEEKYFPPTQRAKLMEIFDSYCNRQVGI